MDLIGYIKLVFKFPFKLFTLPQKFDSLEQRVNILEKDDSSYKCPYCHKGKLLLLEQTRELDKRFPPYDWKCNKCNKILVQKYNPEMEQYHPSVK